MASLADHEKANGARLCRLLIDKGTEALRNVFDFFHPPAKLLAALNSSRPFLQRLHCIYQSQMAILFPVTGGPQSKDFDITLLFILLRNICGLHPPVSTGSWDANPPSWDTTREANLARIKYYRNEVYGHITTTGVNNTDFQSYWNDISSAVVGLGVSEGDVQILKFSPLDENHYIELLIEWKKKEDKVTVMLTEIQKNQEVGLENQKKDSHILEVLLENQKEASDTMKVTFLGQEAVLQNQRAVLEDQTKTSTQLQEVVQELKSMSLNVGAEGQRQPDVLQDFAFCDFKSNIEILNRSFHSHTRIWLFKELDCWFKNRDLNSQVMILTAGPGVGKSVFAAKVCKVYEKKGQLAACHFCKFNYSDYSNPHKMMQSLARHMCNNVPGFREKLTEQLQRNHCRETITDAFRVLLMDPLNSLSDEKPLLLVIDGLDESERGGKSELLDLIGNEFKLLPSWFKVFITSRPELPVKEKLQHLNPIEILPDDENNKLDIQCYLQVCLSKFHNSGQYYLSDLVDKCEGSFLYAYYCQLELNRFNPNTYSFRFVPKCISSVYVKYFTRLEKELKNLSPNIWFDRILEVLVAVEGPLPMRFIADILGLPEDTRSMRKVIQEVNESLSALLLIYDECLTVFHKSVVDWIKCDGYEQHSFSIQEEECISGHKYLWTACQKRLLELKQNGLGEKTSNKYASKHAANHLWEITKQPRFSFAEEYYLPYRYKGLRSKYEGLRSKYEGLVKVYCATDISFESGSGWGWLIAEDSEDVFLMISKTVLCRLKNLWQRNPSIKGSVLLEVIASNKLTHCCAIEREHGFAIVTSDEESVLNYAVLRMRLSSKSDLHFPFGIIGVTKRPPSPGDILAHLFSSSYISSTGITADAYLFILGVSKYPEDLMNWLKTGSNVKNPLVKCEPEMNWNMADDLQDILIPLSSVTFPNEGSFILEDCRFKSAGVIGMVNFSVEFGERKHVHFAVRIVKIIEDINKKQPDLARKLFPSFFKA